MPTVYIVEDDITLRDELARLLELNGYETRACSDFSRAATDIIAANPDCVILDLGLPGADGQSICRDIRREAEMPIIILTAKSDEFTEVMSLNLGAHDFIAKPYRPAVLLARVASLIKRSSSAAAEASTISHAGVTLDLGYVRGALSGQGSRAHEKRAAHPRPAHAQCGRHHLSPGDHVRPLGV